MRAFMSRRFGEGILLGENNLAPDVQLEYFGPHGDMLNLQFNFVLNQAMHLAFARGDPEPLERALAALPDIPPDAAWANWVRNHDELSLDQLSDPERDEVFSVFGQDPDTRIYGRGLRRRLPSMVEGDERRIRLAYSLMFSLPGTPVLFYGEEIGMSENLETEGRLAVRPPMQWSADEHAGFSPPGTDELVRPLCDDYREVNVADQRRDKDCCSIGWSGSSGAAASVRRSAGAERHACPANPASSPIAATGAARPSSRPTTSPMRRSGRRCASRTSTKATSCSTSSATRTPSPPKVPTWNSSWRPTVTAGSGSAAPANGSSLENRRRPLRSKRVTAVGGR
jgi:hypothetical protein